MNLEFEDFEFSRKIVDQTIKIDDDKIEAHIQGTLLSFIGDMDTSSYDVKVKVIYFLRHISALFLNYCVNPEVYLVSEKEIEKSFKSRKIILNIIKSYREQL